MLLDGRKEMTSKPSMLSFNFDDDFGFTAVDEEKVTEPITNKLSDQKAEIIDQLQLLYDAIIPLLKNLKANPDKEYIHWPNRVEKVDGFKSKLDKIVGTTITTKKI